MRGTEVRERELVREKRKEKVKREEREKRKENKKLLKFIPFLSVPSHI